jgi:hypothetical protein
MEAIVVLFGGGCRHLQFARHYCRRMYQTKPNRHSRRESLPLHHITRHHSIPEGNLLFFTQIKFFVQKNAISVTIIPKILIFAAQIGLQL